jgi:hypothetical protein
MSAVDETKATTDEVKEGSADAQNTASEAQGDAIDSVQSSTADSISGLSAVSSETVKTAVGCLKYECEKRKLKANVESVYVSVPALGVNTPVLHEL